MAEDVEYKGLVAETWDAFRGDTSDWSDRHFFLDLIREYGEPVLDVGCGTGRLLLDYLALGVDIDGVDNSSEMLAILRRKAVDSGLDVTGRIFQQTMESLRLLRRYRTIIVPSSSFQLLIDPEAARQALRRFFEHLEPGGTLAMPFIRFEAASDDRSTAEALLPDGTLVRRTAHARYDPVRRLESTDDLYEVFRDGRLVRSERHVRADATRAWTRDEATAELVRAGFENIVWLSNFSREPARDDDEISVVVARTVRGGDDPPASSSLQVQDGGSVAIERRRELDGASRRDGHVLARRRGSRGQAVPSHLVRPGVERHGEVVTSLARLEDQVLVAWVRECEARRGEIAARLHVDEAHPFRIAARVAHRIAPGLIELERRDAGFW